jgi:hypothetical protein
MIGIKLRLALPELMHIPELIFYYCKKYLFSIILRNIMMFSLFLMFIVLYIGDLLKWKWKNIRDTYKRLKRNKCPTRWRFFQCMSFMDKINDPDNAQRSVIYDPIDSQVYYFVLLSLTATPSILLSLK